MRFHQLPGLFGVLATIGTTAACEPRAAGSVPAADPTPATASAPPTPALGSQAPRPADTPALPATVTSPLPADTAIRGKAPPILRGLYLNAYAAGSRSRLRQLLDLADRTEINAFVVDVKDERGIHYRTDLALPAELAQPGEITLRDLGAFADTLHAHGIWAIARIVVFKDPILSRARPDWSIRTPDGALWIDKAGNSWVSSWEPSVWKYNIDIAAEVVEAGFDEVQFDYVRFPEAYASLPEQVHPRADGSRTDAIVRFLDAARARIHPLGGVVAADVFGLSPNDPRDVNIGQQWEAILAAADHVLPMVYPSHYFPTHLKDVPRPNRMPYETVHTSLGIGRVRLDSLAARGIDVARVIPWLQAFSAPWVDRDFDYGPEQAAAQIRAVYDVGIDDWIFWHPGAKYEQIADAFGTETASHRREFTPSPSLLRQVETVERAGARAARDAVTAARTGERSGSR